MEIEWNRLTREELIDYVSGNYDLPWDEIETSTIMGYAQMLYQYGSPIPERILELEQQSIMDYIDLSNLPTDVFEIIGSFADYETLTAVCSSSKALSKICRTFTVWRRLVMNLLLNIYPKASIYGLRKTLDFASLSDLKLITKSLSGRVRGLGVGGLKNKIDNKLFKLIYTCTIYYPRIANLDPREGIDLGVDEMLELVEYGGLPSFKLVENKLGKRRLNPYILASAYIDTDLFIYFVENGYFEDINNIPEYYDEATRDDRFKYIFFAILSEYRYIRKPLDDALIYMITNGLLTRENIRWAFVRIGWPAPSLESFRPALEFENLLNEMIEYKEIQDLYFDFFDMFSTST